MKIAIINEENIITNVVIFDEDGFLEDDTHKYLTPGLWIGDTYTTEISKDITDDIEAQKTVDNLFKNVSKLELITMLAEAKEEVESLREYVAAFVEEG